MSNTSKSHSASLAVSDAVGDRIAFVYSDLGYSNVSQRVYKDSLPEDTGDVEDPYTIYATREMPSVLMGNKDSEDIRAVSEIRTISFLDDVEPYEIAGEIQKNLVDRGDVLSISGFRVVWHDLVFHHPLNEIRQDASNQYGRIMEVEFHLEPTP